MKHIILIFICGAVIGFCWGRITAHRSPQQYIAIVRPDGFERRFPCADKDDAWRVMELVMPLVKSGDAVLFSPGNYVIRGPRK